MHWVYDPGVLGRLEGGRRKAHIAGLVIAVIIGVLAGLGCLGAIVSAAGSEANRVRAGETFGGEVIIAIVCAAIFLVCVAVAVHMEHQLRRHQPLAQSWSAQSWSARPWPAPMVSVRVPGGWAGSPRARRLARRRYSPVATAIQFLVFTAFAVGMLVGTFVIHSEATRSDRVQHHGVLRAGTVTSVHNTYHSSRGGGYYTASVHVSFTPPFDGRDTTVVHYPGRFDAGDGSPYPVLLDPSNPGYAEIPGYPATRSWSWIVTLVFAVLIGVLDFFVGRSLYRMRRHRRATPLPAVT